MNPVDAFFALVLAFAAQRGWSRGLVGAIAGYAAPVLGVMVASDWSDPVRDRLAASVPAPDFVVEALAPMVVFVVVVAVVRLGAAFLSSLLGVGQSNPSRAVAAALSAAVMAVVLGASVLLVREMKPVAIPDLDDEPGKLIASPFGAFVTDLDARLASSVSAPVLADLASTVVSETLLAGRGAPDGALDPAADATAAESAPPTSPSTQAAPAPKPSAPPAASPGAAAPASARPAPQPAARGAGGSR